MQTADDAVSNLFPAKAGDSQNIDTRQFDDSPDSISEDRVSSVLVPDPAYKDQSKILSPTVGGCSNPVQASSAVVEVASSVPGGTVSVAD